LTRLSGFSLKAMDVLFFCGSWVISIFV
jgi:hypothetical protein